MENSLKYLVLLLASSAVLLSCQKETGGGGGGIPPPAQKPKVGTTWIYSYYTYYSYGGIGTISTLTYKAKSEETLGGEKWLKIVDFATDTLVYYLKQKPDGLYQYTNANAYLFCKFPAAVNDAYTSFNAGAAENFVVKGVNDVLPTNIGNVPANYYEGTKGTDIIDDIWFNDNAWIVRHHIYRRIILSGVYYRYSSLFIQSIVY